MREGKTGIARDGSAQALGRFVQGRGVSGRAQPVATHKFRVGEWVLAVAWEDMGRPYLQGPFQRNRNLPCDVILKDS
jgi:hypothetical protein